MARRQQPLPSVTRGQADELVELAETNWANWRLNDAMSRRPRLDRPRLDRAHLNRAHLNRAHLDRAGVRWAVLDCTLLAIACLITYLVVTNLLSRLYFISKDDDLLGGMWAVISTIFVNRDSYRQSVAAAASRMAATSVSFLICLIYLLFLPFHTWALAVLIGASALAVTLIGRPEDAITAAITTAVVMVVAAVSPHHAWQQPILRFTDTVVGVAVGIATAWIGLRMIQPRIRPANGTLSPSPIKLEILLKSPVWNLWRGRTRTRLASSGWRRCWARAGWGGSIWAARW
jgi:hypothetical protein